MVSILTLIRRRDLPLSLRLRLLFFRVLSPLCRFQTPFRVRSSLRRLRHDHNQPWLALLRLFIPYPAWLFAVPEPLPPQELLGNKDLMFHRRRELVVLNAIPIWRWRDTPLRSLYRLYESLISGEYSPLGEETEYFWYQSSWALDHIPDPADPNPIRYAILACLAEELVTAFNWRLSMGMRRNHEHILREHDSDPYPPYTPISGPLWTKHVPPIPQQCLEGLPSKYVRDGSLLVLEEKGRSELFARRNIVTNDGWLYTI
ncbi:hypothetical protein FQN50_004703 [Emmonsiellopsis sp. PD_5]|nr:hypothetical protein FQN50_004703 [Emmonsiellopsis sp. PD_5]